MTIDHSALMSRAFPAVEQSYGWRDCVLYALGLGLGSDPLSPAELAYVLERDLHVLPTMATILGQPGFWIGDAGTGIDASKVVHGEQALELHRPLRVEATIVGQSRVHDIADKGPGRGALVQVETQLRDAVDGLPLATLTGTLFCRGDGGFGGSDHSQATATRAVPSRPPDHAVDRVVPGQAALIFRLSGDMNPLHADPAVARGAGFARPVLHGLATFGIAGFSLTQGIEAGRALRFMACRFTAPLFPGETLRTEIWGLEDGLAFRCRALERDRIVLDRGTARLD